MKAMILAAGFGTRLQPFTFLCPKPLFPVLNRPLLGLTIRRLRAAGCAEIVVNVHHLAARLEDFLGTEEGIVLQREEEILGTGGGLRRALPHLGSEPVLVTNGDIVHSLDFATLYARHCSSGAAVSLVLHDFARFNRVRVDENGTILDFGDLSGPGRRLAFTGIHVLDPRLLRGIPEDTFYSIIDWYRELQRRGTHLKALVVSDHFWTDIGTPADYLGLHRELLTGRISLPDLPAGKSPILLADACSLAEDVRLADWVCLGPGVTVGAGASLRRVVAWEGARIRAGAHLEDAIVT